jgi:hypothetical protein
LRQDTLAAMQLVPALDWALCQVDENLRVLTQWCKVYPDDDPRSQGYLVIGQIEERGQPHGVARVISASGWDIREGQFWRGELHGHGKDGLVMRSYVGEYKLGSKHGQGTYIDERGKYKGAWENDWMHGEGTWTSAQGNEHAGVWHKGELNGVGYWRLV